MGPVCGLHRASPFSHGRESPSRTPSDHKVAVTFVYEEYYKDAHTDSILGIAEHVAFSVVESSYVERNATRTHERVDCD